MFQHRENSRKPSEEFYNSFREAHPEVHIDVATSSAATNSSEASISNGLTDNSFDPRGILGQNHEHINNPTLDTYDGPWMFTPPLIRWNSLPLNGFANQYGNPHAPGMAMAMRMGMGIEAMLPLPASDDNHFAPDGPFALCQYPYQPSGLESIFPSDESGIDRDTKMQDDFPSMSFLPPPYDTSMPVSPILSSEKFRFHVTLNAPTAMIEQADGTPVTYLNKNQTYLVSIAGTESPPRGAKPVQYRTSIWVSFQDEQQRRNPAVYWQHWKDVRRMKETRQRDSQLHAITCVETVQPDEDDCNITKFDLEASFPDGFSVLWASRSDGSGACTIGLRFDFLSTDFSRSKGVQGVLNRLCVKTEILTPISPPSATEDPEICFCQVQLFRDHGAERKLSNNTALVKKVIKKLKEQIAEPEPRLKEYREMDRARSAATYADLITSPGKPIKRKRAMSTSSPSHAGGRGTTKAELYSKLRAMQNKSISAQPVSVLYLRGASQDDYDPRAVQVIGEHLDLTRREAKKNADWQRSAGSRSSTIDGASSLISPPEQGDERSGDGSSTVGPPPSHGQWKEFQPMSPAETRQHSSNAQRLLTPPDQPFETQPQAVEKASSGILNGRIEAFEVNLSYRPPPERTVKPVACFYVLYRGQEVSVKDHFYRAVYVMRRDSKELVTSIAAKCNMEPTQILRIVHVNQKGLTITVDDSLVRELPEGLDMIVEFCAITAPPAKREWDKPVDSVLDSEETSTEQNVIHSEGYELRLIF